MEELLSQYGFAPKGFRRGEHVEGTVVEITPKALVVNIGGKSQGLVTQKAFIEVKDFIKTLKVGDKISAEVLIPETPDGYTILSLRRSSQDAAWKALEAAYDSGNSVRVRGKLVSGAGVSVDYSGLGGFVPSSQVSQEYSQNMNVLIGRNFDVMVIDLSREQNRLVLSQKALTDAADIKLAKEALGEIVEGEIYDGEVVETAEFGCFVRLKLPKKSQKDVILEGLVHISHLSWNKVQNTGDVVKKGDKVKVKVIGIRDGKLALSIKEAQGDPWEKIEKKFKLEDKIDGKVSKVSDYGIFVEIAPGIDGLVHMTKIPPGKKFNPGESVKVFVEDINPTEKRISLGLVLTEKPLGYK